MKPLLRVFGTAMLACALLLGMAFPVDAQKGDRAPGFFYASDFTGWSIPLTIGNSATGSQTDTLIYGYAVTPGGATFLPIATNVPLQVDIGTPKETITPSAVSNCVFPIAPSPCTFTATFANVHVAGASVFSGDNGVAEAYNAAVSRGGGVVIADASKGATAANITSLSTANANVVFQLIGSSANGVWYVPNAAVTAYVQAPNQLALPVLSVSITPTATAAVIGVATQTFTFTGLASGDKVYAVGLPTPTALCPPVGFRATAANTLSIDFTVLTAAACTPAAGSYAVLVVR